MIKKLSSIKDLVIIFIITIILWIVFSIIDAFEIVIDFLKLHEDYELDEVLLLFILFGFFFIFYSIRRVKEAISVNRQLKSLNKKLEEKVEEKTKELKLINEHLEEKVKEEVSKNRQKDILLIQNSKMAAFGEMLSLIIHQWKQPLNHISLINIGIELRLKLDQVDNKILEEDTLAIKKQIEHMASTMEEFRNFFMQKEKEVYSVKEAINLAISFIEGIFKFNNVIINLNMEDKKYLTLGYKNELIQVLINLFNNARDIILEKNCKIKTIDLFLHSVNNDIIIEIKDYAGGVSPQIITKIFEPYFTTKSKDKGTGLGLYMCKSILEKVQATIEVENSLISIDNIEYKGANFKITLKKYKG
ncbi:HAMP domain-containing sensor histidine kinase [Malaciobacter mytili]|uniref:sensor histidine kinase n=1 Tax=Malaciobacter mytili TaxID=603050 RepID=UPI003BAED6C9